MPPSSRSRLRALREDDLRLAFALRPCDGPVAQQPMTPSTRGRPAAVPPGTPVREAAALLYAFEAEGALWFPLTLRRDDLREHRGQVSLPGGRPDPGEDLWETALREAREEVGLVHPGARLGVLHPVLIPHTHTRLHVHVALGPDPRPLSPAADEVARLAWGRLDDLLNPACRGEVVRRIEGFDVPVPAFFLDGLEVWGATAMALSDLAERLIAVRAGPSLP